MEVRWAGVGNECNDNVVLKAVGRCVQKVQLQRAAVMCNTMYGLRVLNV